ncbi:acetyl-CoA hydrolase/transferase C-terminal domain-containing protein [Ferrimicrobium sp.]|uniref:acetyl-CoA hydrolase/transferase family protein n=1 Tax=Ferrimicrobium sp. TaxID=2926050 RepID=UPI00260175D1|nr:acetyl-CoA hydrolase/transferase C-terminal domain-containing protein [Ferrimicrobium sp.]
MKLVTLEILQEHFAQLGNHATRVVVSGNFATPHQLLDAFDRAVPEYRLFILNPHGAIPDRPGVTYESPFLGPAIRDAGTRLEYLPMRLSLVPLLLASVMRPDVTLIHVSRQLGDHVSLGTEVNILPAAIEQTHRNGGLVVAQINEAMPYTYGDSEVSVDLIDLAFSSAETLTSPDEVPRNSNTETTIASLVTDLIKEGATLQLGIGAIPNAVAAQLTHSHGLRIWSEMISDGVLNLERVGALDPEHQLVASFLFGSSELYAWCDLNPRLRLARTETVNDPSNIAQQPRMTAINSAFQVDLFAQANANFINGRFYSGIGGQADFTVGALHAVEGHSIIALPSWHEKSHSSTVVERLDGPVTSFQHSAIISEQGRAMLFGRSSREQAMAIAGQVAHPKVRPELQEVVEKGHLS